LKSARYLLGAVRTGLVEYYTWFLFAGIYLVMGIFVPTIFTSAILLNVLVQGTTVCLLSIGMTFVMLVGEIDLSMVAVAAFSPMA
jgi:ribose/xylose/arabinose/galactoside ABC-type transport system permease subunit